MKRCPDCRRDYFDDSLSFCLDDGSQLLEGPSSPAEAPSEQPTLSIPSERNSEDATVILLRSNKASERSSKLKTPTGLVTAAVVLLLLIAGLSWYVLKPSPRPEIRSLAVLPLENLSGDPAQDYFADGMTEALIGNLSQISSLKVISRTSIMRYRKTTKAIPEIAKELGVDGIIEGSVQRSGDRVKISTQLIRAATDSPMWSRNYERQMSDILQLQSEIAQALAAEIRATISPSEERRLKRSKPLDPQATEAFLLGKHYFHKWTIETERQAVEQFQKAVTIEPEYADAWAGLSDAWTVRAIIGDISAKEAEAPTKAAAFKAIEIDPENSAAHISMCFVNNNYNFDWVAAEESCRRGLSLDPNNAKGHFAYAYMLSRIGRHDEMAEQMEVAMKLDPAEAWWPSVYGGFLVQARRFELAEKMYARAVQVDPTYTPSYTGQGALYIELGRFDEALRSYEKAGVGAASARMAHLYGRMGEREKALKILDNSSSDMFDQILAYAALGDLDKAFELIERALNEGHGFMFGYANYLELDKLKTDPRWEPIRLRMNLPK